MLVTAYDQRTGRAYQVRPQAVGDPTIAPNLALTPPAGKSAGRKTTGNRPVVPEAPTEEPQIETPAIGEKE